MLNGTIFLLRNSISGDIKLVDKLYVIEFVRDKHERRIGKMNKVKKLFVLVLIFAVISLGFIGCEHKGDHPSGEHPSGEHPSKGAEANEAPGGEHPGGEHPSGEHPK
jgi:hypothetical protein